MATHGNGVSRWNHYRTTTATTLKALGILAEASLMLWLIAMGVNVQRWKEQASAARSSGGPPGD